ncbi:MAG: efflux RND transporter permease subunit [Proteobacteria bacterium]|nr:efflux RND transporter permease subunit [Pseudomonadota bacterium]
MQENKSESQKHTDPMIQDIPQSNEKEIEEKAEKEGLFKGPLAWMARNHVAANLLMFTMILGGIIMVGSLRQELMPNVEAERIQVSASYPGSSPDEVEEGIVIAIEEAVRGINGVKKTTSTASEGSGRVVIELLDGADVMRTRNEIERAVDQIVTFPDDMEKPQVREMTRKQRVLSVLVSGNVGKHALREAAESVRDELLTREGVSIIELSNVESPEIAVEISQEATQAYGLKIADVAQAISSSSVDLSAGNLKAESGAVMLRTQLKKEYASEFENVVLKVEKDGRTVRLSDVATVTDGFEESDYSSYYNGEPAVGLTVYAVGHETPVSVSDTVRDYLADNEGMWPEGISVNIRSDNADSYRVRIDLLMDNAKIGLLLVLFFLGLFLDIRIAFWAAMGMLCAFVGAIAVMVMLDVSFNMISLFAFILALGIVVDDSIVVGEAVYVHREKGASGIVAAIKGLREVSTPVMFSVITTIIAFVPLLFLPGMLGKTYRDLPIIVIIILCLSIFECMLIMPAHLSGMSMNPQGFIKHFRDFQAFIARGFEYIVEKTIRPLITFSLNNRYVVTALSIALIIATIGYVASGRLRYTMMPEVEGDTVSASIRMADGSPVSRMQEVERFFLEKTQNVVKQFGEDTVVGIFSQVSGGSSASVQAYLVPATERTYASSDFANAWRKEIGEIAGVEAMSFRFNQGPGGGGAGASFNLSHRDSKILDAAAEEFATRLKRYNGVKDVDVNVAKGKAQLSYKLTPEARALGVTESDFARQLRAAVHGSEALRQQRGRNEVKVFVRYPLADRQSEALVEDFLIKTPKGGEIPLSAAATVERGHAPKSISRENGKRILTVSAELDGEVTTIESLTKQLNENDIKDMQASFPGLTLSMGGMHADSGEMFSKMALFFGFSIFVMFAMMATAFRSYSQPIMIMLAIPFGFVGAILGHIILGYSLSLISILGMIALSGVVVNASIVMTSVINDNLAEGMTLRDAVIDGSVRRFRPIFLSVTTTFLGVFPMILETSKEARFLIPMAISLGIGVIFSAVITLLIVPCNYLILDDIKRLLNRIFG